MSWQAIVQALVLVVSARGDGAVPRPVHGPRVRSPRTTARHPATGSSSRSSGRSTGSAASTPGGSSAGTSTPSRWWRSASSRCSLLYAIYRLQGFLPFNPTDRPGVSPMGSFNAAISFVTNTNWQWFSGECQHQPPHEHVRQHRPELRVGRRRHGGRGRADPRHHPHRHPQPRQLLGRPGPHGAAHPAPAVPRVLGRADVAGRDPELQRRHRRRHDRPDPGRPGRHVDRDHRAVDPRWSASPRRRRSRNSARTVVASTTPTRRTRSAIRTASPTSCRSGRCC